MTTRSTRSISEALRKHLRELGGVGELDGRHRILVAALTTAATGSFSPP
jgi:hypothetical protein